MVSSLMLNDDRRSRHWSMETRRPPSTCSRRLVLVLVTVLGLVVTGSQGADAKRFDCQMFCRTTGFHGVVGGCRCGFTLFTSKRSPSSPSPPSHLQLSPTHVRELVTAMMTRFPRSEVDSYLNGRYSSVPSSSFSSFSSSSSPSSYSSRPSSFEDLRRLGRP